jgi:homoserine kinase
VPHADASYTAARAALLGAAVAAGSVELFAAALGDRLHEPYRGAADPRLAAVRADLPPGALGATISGSGPSLIVWARAESASACAGELARRYPDVQVSALGVSPRGAHSF